MLTQQNDKESGLFDLSIDPVTKAFLIEVAKWARLLAISGLVLFVLFLVARLFPFIVAKNGGRFFSSNDTAENAGEIFGTLIIVLIPVISFLYLFRFSASLKKALEASDQTHLNETFKWLKVYFRYLAIITIILLVFIVMATIINVGGLVR